MYTKKEIKEMQNEIFAYSNFIKQGYTHTISIGGTLDDSYELCCAIIPVTEKELDAYKKLTSPLQLDDFEWQIPKNDTLQALQQFDQMLLERSKCNAFVTEGANTFNDVQIIKNNLPKFFENRLHMFHEDGPLYDRNCESTIKRLNSELEEFAKTLDK